MNKSHKKFIDKNKAVIFKLIYRDSEDPNKSEFNQEQRVFSVISMPKDEHLNPEEIKTKNRILENFNDKEQGKFERQIKEKESKSPYIPPEIMEKLKGQDNLWINQLQKLKQEKMKQQKQGLDDKNNFQQDDDAEYEVEELEEVEEEEDDYYQGEDEDYDDEQDYNDKDYDSEDYSNNNEEKKHVQQKQEQIQQTKSNEAETKKKQNNQENIIIQEKKQNFVANQDNQIENDDDGEEDIELPDYNKLEFHKDIKMRKFDEFGLPVDDGYNYHQHLAKPNSEGKLVAVINADYDEPPKLVPDIDYEISEMTQEQKEVFESLQYAGTESVYEKLEDDFVKLAQEGEECIINNKMKENPQIIKKQEDNNNKVKDNEEKAKGCIKQKQQGKKKEKLENKKKVNFPAKLEITEPFKQYSEKTEQIISKQDMIKQNEIHVDNNENDEEEWEDQDDEEYNANDDKKANNQQIKNQQNIKEKQSNKNQQDLNMSDEEFDDKEFSEAINEFESCEQQDIKKSEMQNKISHNEFMNILDSHIENMQTENINNNSKQQNQNQINKSVNKEVNNNQDGNLKVDEQDLDIDQNDDQEDKKQQKKLQRQKEKKKKSLLNIKEEKRVYKNIKPEELFTKKYIAPLTLEEDKALQNYLNKDESSEDNDENIEREIVDSEESDNENIGNKQFNQSTVHEHLTVIKEQAINKKKKSKQSEDLSKDKDELLDKQNKNNKQSGEYEEENEDLKQNQNNKPIKISKNETKEERQMRKQMLKDQKKERKQKKQQIKEQICTITKEQIKKVNLQTNSQNMRGVSIVKL